MNDTYPILKDWLAKATSNKDNDWIHDKIVGFRVDSTEHRLNLSRGCFEDLSCEVDAWFECSSETLREIYFGDRLPQAAVEQGKLRVSGDVELVMRFGALMVSDV